MFSTKTLECMKLVNTVCFVVVPNEIVSCNCVLIMHCLVPSEQDLLYYVLTNVLAFRKNMTGLLREKLYTNQSEIFHSQNEMLKICVPR